MFRKSSRSISSTAEWVLGFRLAQELEVCGTKAMRVFGVDDYYRDYEDTWEWVEGTSPSGIKVNLSRPHDWDCGRYELSVLVKLEGPADLLTQDAVARYSQELALALRTEIGLGNVEEKPREPDRYQFRCEKRFSCTSRHRTSEELEADLAALGPAGLDKGRLSLIVRRNQDESRTTPHRICLSIEEGIPEDNWNRRLPANPETQLAVMRQDVAEMISDGQPLTTFGDNLFVQLDLSAANLPAGTQLKCGEAILEVTPMPHNGCRKFQSRFGADALKFVNAPKTRSLNLRGVYWRVIHPGWIQIGDIIQVVSR